MCDNYNREREAREAVTDRAVEMERQRNRFRADLAAEKSAHEETKKARDDHFAVRLLAERERDEARAMLSAERAIVAALCTHAGELEAERDMAKAEMERLMALVREWLDGNARLGRPKSVADQRFLNGLKVTG